MFEVNRNPFIKIDLEPGVYTFGRVSGQGKTWLYKLFYDYEGYGEKVACYSYRDFKLHRDPTDEFQNAQVIMIDRYDMYRGYLDSLIATLKNKIILIDYKICYAARENDQYCSITLHPNGIEVTT